MKSDKKEIAPNELKSKLERAENNIRELEKKNAELEKKTNELQDELREKKLVLSAFKSLPEHSGYIKDKNGKYIDDFGKSRISINLEKDNNHIGKNDIQILHENYLDNLKRQVLLTDKSIHIKAASFFLKVDFDNENNLKFYYKKKHDEKWSLIGVEAVDFSNNEIYCGFVLASSNQNAVLEVDLEALHCWSESKNSTDWQSHLFHPQESWGSFEAKEEGGLYLSAKGVSPNEGLFVYQKMEGLFSLSCCVRNYRSPFEAYRPSFGLMIRESLDLNSKSFSLLYRAKEHVLALKRGVIADFHTKAYDRFLENHKQDQDVLYQKKIFSESLPWTKITKSPFFDSDGVFAGLIASYTKSDFRQIIDNCLSDAVIVFTTEGRIKLFNDRALDILIHATPNNELQNKNIFTLYGKKRVATEDFHQIVYDIRLEEGKRRIKDPVQFQNAKGELFHFQEYYSSFLNIYTGLIDRIVLVLSNVSVEKKLPAVSGGENSVDYRITLIRNFLMEHFRENFSILKMVKNLGINYNTAKRVFKKQTGKTINYELMKIRLQQASRLLIQTNISIIDIAIESGFSSHGYFSKKFKEHFGVSPSTYRIKHVTG